MDKNRAPMHIKPMHLLRCCRASWITSRLQASLNLWRTHSHTSRKDVTKSVPSTLSLSTRYTALRVAVELPSPEYAEEAALDGAPPFTPGPCKTRMILGSGTLYLSPRVGLLRARSPSPCQCAAVQCRMSTARRQLKFGSLQQLQLLQKRAMD